MSEPIRIGNISGLFGDRPTAMREMLADPAVEVLTGDWLAELTMLILARTRMKRPDGGYGRTFVTQVSEVLDEILERGIRVVVNAGGLDPLGCAAAVEESASRLGLEPKVAAITGDDLAPRLGELIADGYEFRNLETGEKLGDRPVIVANAYLGGWGIARALEKGADIVVTGRVTDAALAVGPAIWRHGWVRDDWDRLAGAVVAGHVIECGSQATGGNYSFFSEIEDMVLPGFPWAEVAQDGSSVIGKPDGSGGEVTVGTVTSQLLYEVGGPRYHNPDVTVRMDSISIEQLDTDRVRLTGIRGEPPPETLKVSAAYPGGFRNSLMIGLTGTDDLTKMRLLEKQVWAVSPVARDEIAETRTTLIGGGVPDPDSNAAAISYVEFAVADPDEDKVGREWSNALASIALASIPGLFGVWPPGPAKPYAVFWPTTISRDAVTPVVHLGGESWEVLETEPGEWREASVPRFDPPPAPLGDTTTLAALGLVVGARSGDKGGNANLGVFARSESAHGWLHEFLTVERLKQLLPDLAELEVERFEFPRLRAVNFLIHGLLDEGVASTLRVDPQAKGLGEYLRAKLVELPTSLFSGAAVHK
ncbi:MAG: acyclic terpene utilization AtuA family protein [Acidimicrobiia bacterium]